MSSLLDTGTPVWLRAVMTREGDDVVTRCCVVTEGQFFPVEVRVNVPKLIATLQLLGMAPKLDARDGVSGFGSWLKKAVKTVTHNKVTKAVGSVVSKVVKSPIVQIANPMLAVSAHTLSRAATGKGTIKGPAGKLVDAGTAAVMKVAPVPNALNFVSAKASAALGVGLKTVTSARAGAVIASVAKNAQAEVNLGRSAAAILKRSPGNAEAKRLVQRAVAVRSGVQKNAQSLAKRVVLSSKVKANIGAIAQKARAGSSDAKLAASVIARSAQALDTVAHLKQASAGGVAGLLITADGRIVRAPKGRFLQRASAVARPDVLYRGPKDPTLKGSFAAVSGTKARRKRAQPYQPGITALKRELQHCAEAYDELAGDYFDLTQREPARYDDPRVLDAQGWTVGATQGWGGDLDPGDDIDGPMYPVTPDGGRVLLDDYSAVAGRWTP